MKRLYAHQLTKAFWALLLAALLTSPSWAQTPQYYSTAQGLPSTRISHIMFDEEDFLWVSTDLGLSRFTGKGFVNYQAHSGNPYQLQENMVNRMFVDSNHNHWVGASDGLYYFCRTENKFKRYPVSEEHTDISISTIVEHPLRPHTLLMSTFGWGIQVFDTQTRTYNHAAADSIRELIQTVDASYIYVDSHHRLWVFKGHWIDVIDLAAMRHCSLNTLIPPTEQNHIQVREAVEDCQNGQLFLATVDDGLLQCDLSTMQLQRLPIPVTKVNALSLTPDCKLAIGTEGEGVWGYNPQTHAASRFTSGGPVNLDRAKVHSISFDAQENLWMGIYQQGVLMLPGPNCIFTLNAISADPDDARNLASATAFAYLPDGSRAYGLDGAGVVVEYADHSRVHYEKNNSALTTNAVMCLIGLPDGRLLIGTFQGGIFVIDKDHKLRREPTLSTFDNLNINGFAYDSQDNLLYVATNGEGLFAYSLSDKSLSRVSSPQFSMKWITKIFMSSRRRLWVSGADHLRCYDPETGEIFSPAQDNTVLAIHDYAEDDNGEIWMASSHGLLHYDQQLDSVMPVAEEEAALLPSYASIIYAENRLWLSSTGCLTAYDPKSGDFSRYHDRAIASVGTMSNHASILWPDSTLWFGGDNGAIKFHPQTVFNYRHASHPLYLEELWVDNVPTDYDPSLGKDNALDAALWCATQLRLPSTSASFSLTYNIKDINGTMGYLYRHRLRGYEKEWHENHGSDLMASYQSLSPGNYVLEINAIPDNDETGNSAIIRELKVTVLPPWWATWWANLLWLLIVGSAIGISVKTFLERRREKKALRMAELSRQVKEEKLDLLTSVSHEIKTPLTLIISPLRKLMQRKGDLATQSVLEMMYRNALRILMLVNQQMDVRKLDNGQLKLHVREMPLRSFLDDMMQYFSNLALNRHVKYSLSLPEGRDEMTIWADPQQIDKVLLNLLSNAIKFVNEQGTVRVSVSDTTLPNGAAATRITVYNSGSQLPPEAQAKAFAGIGLTLARNLTELHQGRLTVRNIDEGVAFDVDLRNGKEHFSSQDLEAKDTNEHEMSQNAAAIETAAAIESAVSIEQSNSDQNLMEQLSDELREKQRLRERRSNMGFDYTQIQMSSADEKLMRRVVDVIHKNIADADFSVETLSTEVGISRVHLNRKLKELIDTSPSALIKSVRLKQAAFLLVQSNVTVAEVAYSVGFSSPAYFSSNFSQFFGMTPKEFTSMYTENPDSEELKKILEM